MVPVAQRSIPVRQGSAFKARLVRGAGAGFLATGLGGCSSAGAPSLPFFGAYFPSWLLCAALGILGAVLVRVVFVKIGIDDALPARLPVYVCIAAGIGFLISIVSFGR